MPEGPEMRVVDPGCSLIPGPRSSSPRVATEMALHVLAYNITRVLNIIGIKPLMAAVRANTP